MKSWPSLQDWNPDGTPSAVTIGMFDGVHRGHQALLSLLNHEARKRDLRTVALTFDRHPRELITGRPVHGYLTPLPEKLQLLSECGLAHCIVLSTSEDILNMDAADFVTNVLVEKLSARLVVIGYDFRFGHGRHGDFALLGRMARQSGYTVLKSEAVIASGSPIKSTRIHQCLDSGDMGAVAELMGRRYSMSGEVIAGDRIGRQLGFPTANVMYPHDKKLPAPGVYAGVACLAEMRWPAAINLGRRPTVSSASGLLLEAHLPGFSGDLYGQRLTLEFVERLRNEQSFPNVGALREQIQRDTAAVLARAERWERQLVDGWPGPGDPLHITPAAAGEGG